MKVSRNSAVSWTALAFAGVIGGVTAVSLVGGQQPERVPPAVVRNVSDVGAESTPSGQASAPAAAPSASDAVAVPTAAPAGTSDSAQTSATTTRSETVTDPAPTTQPAPVDTAPDPVTEPAPAEPAPTEPTPSPEPPAPPANSGGESGPPVATTRPTSPGYECLPQEYVFNPRCPAPSPTD